MTDSITGEAKGQCPCWYRRKGDGPPDVQCTLVAGHGGPHAAGGWSWFPAAEKTPAAAADSIAGEGERLTEFDAMIAADLEACELARRLDFANPWTERSCRLASALVSARASVSRLSEDRERVERVSEIAQHCPQCEGRAYCETGRLTPEGGDVVVECGCKDGSVHGLVTALREALAAKSSELARLSASVEAPTKDKEALREFAVWVCEQHTGSIDGCEIEDQALRLGLLVKVEVNGPCGEECECAGYDGWPIDCHRFAPILSPAPAPGASE